MVQSREIQRKRRRRILVVALVLLTLMVGAGGIYGWRMHRQAAHVDGLKPQGLERLEEGDHQQAMNLLASYLGRHPNDVEALRAYATARARVYDSNGAHMTQTMNVLRRLVQLDPGDEASQRELLELYLQARFSTEAVELADSLLEVHPDDPQALRAKARALGQTRSFREAYEVAVRYNTLHPEDIELQILTLTIMQARDQRAGEIVQRARALALEHAGDGRFLMVLGVAHQITGDVENARLIYQEAAEHLPEDAEEIGRLAELMDQVGLFRQATELLQQAERAMDDPVLVRLLIRRLWEQGRNDLVIQRAESFDPTDDRADTEAIAVLATALIQTGDREKALAFIKQLERRGRDHLAQAWVSLLKVLMEEGRAGGRLANAASTALLRYPNHPYFHFFHGTGLFSQGRQEEAIEAWQQAGRVAPSWAAPLLRVAQAFLHSERPYLAIEVARGAVQRAPNNVEAVLVLLETYAANLEHLDDELAEHVGQMMEQVVAEVPETRRRLLPLIADLHGRKGELEAAAELIRLGLEMEPPLSGRVLLQLANVSRQHGLGLTDACLDAAEAIEGGTPQLAFARALRVAGREGVEQSLATFARHAEAAGRQAQDADVQRVWQLQRVRLLEVIDREQAIHHWRQLVEIHPEDLTLHEAAAQSVVVWNEIDLARQVVRQLGALTDESGNTWRIARARLLMQGQAASQRALADASLLLLDVTRQLPYLIEPRLMLAQCFERMGQPRRALEFFEQAHRLSPHSASIALDRARLLQAVGEADRAGEMLRTLAGRDDFTLPQQLQYAMLLGQRGDFATAERLLNSILAQAPNHRRTQQLLAGLYAGQGRTEEAEALFRVLLEEPDAMTLQVAVNFYEAQGQIARARQLLDQLDEVEMAHDERALARAAFQHRQREPGQAIATLREATDRGPVRMQLWEQLIVFQLQAGQVREALASAEKAASAYPDEPGVTALVRHRRMVETVAEQPRLRALALHIVADEDHREAAVAALRLLVDADRNRRQTRDVAVELRQLADRSPRFLALQNLMVAMYQTMGRHNDAADLAVRTMRTLPDTPQAAWTAAEALAAAERWDEALRVSQQLRALSDGNQLGVDLMIAEAQLRLGRAGAAAAQLHDYLGTATTPEMNLLVHRTQARALIGDGRAEEARDLLRPMLAESAEHRRLYIELAVSVLPKVEEAGQWLADVAEVVERGNIEERFGLAQAWRSLDERFVLDCYTPKAVELLEQLAEIDSASATAHQMLGIIHESQGRLEQAEASYRQALAQNPELPVALNNLAMVVLQRGEQSEGLHLAQQAASLQPNVPAFQDTLALACLANGQADAAMEAAQRAVQLEPRKIEWYITLGEAMVQARQKEQARELIDQLNEQLPADAQLPGRLQERLESLRRLVDELVGLPVSSSPTSADAHGVR